MNAMARRREELIGPTDETLSKLEPDALQSMLFKGLIDQEEYDAALEIANMHRIMRRSLFKTQRPGSVRTGSQTDPTDGFTESQARRYSTHFLPWAREQARHIVFGWPRRMTRLDLVLAVADDNQSIRSIGIQHDAADHRVLASLLRPLQEYVRKMR